MIDLVPIAAVALVGLAIGSFLNVVAHRVPVGLSVVSPPSACPGCDTRIRAVDNVPLVSWLLLRGACRHCRAPISVRYPLVEAVTGLLFGAVAVRFLPALLGAPTATAAVADALELAAYLYLMAVSVALTAIDLDVRRLPDRIVLPSYAVGAALLGGADLLRGDGFAASVAGAGAGASVGFYLALALVKPGGMGMGDVKLAGVLGLFLGHLGVDALVVGTAGAFLTGGVFGLLLLATSRAGRGATIPFGPWMLAGTWIGVFAGARLAGLYLGAVGLF